MRTLQQRDCDVRIPVTKLAALLAAVDPDQLHETESHWLGGHEFESEYNAAGDLIGIEFTGMYASDAIEVEAALAPFMDPDSWIEWKDIDGDIYRSTFDGVSVRYTVGTLVFK